MLFNSVNQHCLNSIVRLAETRPVEAAEDIFDERGMKLWAKGKPVSADLQEKLLRRKLAKPLEATLAVEGAIGFPEIIEACRAHLEQNPLFSRLVDRGALGLLDGLRNLPLPQPLRLLLTTAHVGGTRSYHHALATMLVCAAIASRLSASEQEAQHLLISALLHDLGEIYINPDYLDDSRRLLPHEWKHVASHPRVGQLLIQELTTMPAVVGLCVAHHHERLDGSGYPQQIERSKHHRLGGWLAVGDSVGAILSRGDAGAPLRAALALRIVPEEFDRDAVAVVTQALRKNGDRFDAEEDCSCFDKVRTTCHQLDAAVEQARALQAAPGPMVRQAAAFALAQLQNLSKSLRATGAVEAGSLAHDLLDVQVVTEVCLIVREVEWRMRNLARNLHLRAEMRSDGDPLVQLAPLIEALDGQAGTDAPSAAG